MTGYFIDEGPYLAHYGVLGMKWGIRRYQNYDGSYTKEGVRRYREHEEAYNRAKARMETATNKADYTNAKVQKRIAKRQMKKTYKQLKKDKLADKGREIYGKGTTISQNRIKGYVAAAATGLTLGAINKKFGGETLKTVRMGNNYLVVHPELLMLGVGGASMGYKIHLANQNYKLRKYYKHPGRKADRSR